MTKGFSMERELAALESALGLRAGFIEALSDEDDWSFVIKAHALLEAAVSQLLAHELARPELVGVFTRLEMASGSGKLTFGETLGVIDKRARRFIRALGEIRNDFVHQVSNSEIRLPEYWQRLDKQQFQAKRSALDLLFKPDDVVVQGDPTITAEKLFRSSPKLLIASSLGIVLTQLHVRTITAKAAAEMLREADQVFTEFLLDATRSRRTIGEIAADGSAEPPQESST